MTPLNLLAWAGTLFGVVLILALTVSVVWSVYKTIKEPKPSDSYVGVNQTISDDGVRLSREAILAETSSFLATKNPDLKGK